MSNDRPERLTGLRVLVAEDEVLVAMDLGAMLSDLGCHVLGPVPDLERAIALAQGPGLDGAVLDINLQGRLVYPLAWDLDRRGVPFIFTTGYAINALPEGLRNRRALSKPFGGADLEEAVRSAFLAAREDG